LEFNSIAVENGELLYVVQGHSILGSLTSDLRFPRHPACNKLKLDHY